MGSPRDDDPLSDDNNAEGLRAVEPLDAWARALSLALGLAATTFGCYAVLASDNQAGTAFILLAGAVLLLLGLQGTPLRRLSSGEHTLELADIRRRRAALEVVKRATEEEAPDVAAAVVDAVQEIEPSGGFQRSRELIYQRAVLEAIQGLGINARLENLGPSGRYEILAELPSGIVKVEAKYKQTGPLTIRDVQKTRAWAALDRQAGWLLVSNAPLSGEVRLFNANDAEGAALEAITWNDDKDNDLLMRALTRRASS
jgi:hypothetical protein